jgi:3-oxoadipate enol-lactonase
MSYLDTPDARLYYEVHGDGPPLVLAHGGGGSHLSWWQQVPALARAHTVVTYDHRGFGSSSGDGSADIWQHVGDLEALLDALGIERASLVGQSMGGLTVGGFATTRPARVASLAVCSSWAGIRTPEVAAWCVQLASVAPSTRAGLFHPTFAERRPDLLFLYREIVALTPRRAEHLAEGVRAIDAFTTDGSVLSMERIPTLFVVGEVDGLTPAVESVARTLPHARLEVVREAGHSAHFERADAVNELLADFVSAAPSAS